MTDGRRSHKGSCPTGKRPYYQERLANRAITKAAKRGELTPLRHYPCPECGWWHLARKHKDRQHFGMAEMEAHMTAFSRLEQWLEQHWIVTAFLLWASGLTAGLVIGLGWS